MWIRDGVLQLRKQGCSKTETLDVVWPTLTLTLTLTRTLTLTLTLTLTPSP